MPAPERQWLLRKAGDYANLQHCEGSAVNVATLSHHSSKAVVFVPLAASNTVRLVKSCQVVWRQGEAHIQSTLHRLLTAV